MLEAPTEQDLKIRLVATKQLKRYQANKTFERQEAFRFVQTVLKQAKSTHNAGMLGFDAHFKNLAGKRATLEFGQMTSLCAKVAQVDSKNN